MLTVKNILELPEVRRAAPTVVAGTDRLNNAVRWVRALEVGDAGPHFRNGDLVLSTGLALPGAGKALSSFLSELADSSVAGLVLHPGQHRSELPATMIDKCGDLGLPLVALGRESQLSHLLQVLGERLIDEQLEELRKAQRIHDVFTHLALSEAPPSQILAAAHELAGAAVAIEGEQHQLLDFLAATGEQSGFARDWERRSRSIQDAGKTVWDARNGWLVSPIGLAAGGGRLIIASAQEPPQTLTSIAERAAAALAAHRLRVRGHANQVHRQHRDLLNDMLHSASSMDVCRRTWLAGLQTENRKYVGLVLRSLGGPSAGSAPGHGQLDRLAAACLRTAETLRLESLVAAFEVDVRVLLAIPSVADEVAVVDRFAREVQALGPVVAAAGTAATTLKMVDRTLRESMQVMAAISPSADHGSVHRLDNLHLRGLLTLLSEDARVKDFAERELGPLHAASKTAHFDVFKTTQTLITHWGNRSKAAAALHISRTVLYQRIDRIEEILGASLSDADVRTSLHVAFLYAPPPVNGT